MDEKLAMISMKRCQSFVDDLVEVLEHKDFPKEVNKILYSQSGHQLPQDITQCSTWEQIIEYLLDKNACLK